MNYAWLAGFFDGDGTIGVWTNHVKPVEGYTPRISLYNTFEPVLLEIQNEIGGRLNLTSYTLGRQKKCWMLTWTGDEAREVLKQILPYLKIKAEVAQIAINFPVRKRMGHGKIDTETLGVQRLEAAKIHTLNMRGVLWDGSKSR